MVVENGITSIGESLFENCINLNRIFLSDSITSVGEYSCAGCGSLSSIYYKGNSNQWNSIAVADYNNVFRNVSVECNSDYDIIVSTQPYDNVTITEYESVYCPLDATGRNLTYHWQKLASGGCDWEYIDVYTSGIEVSGSLVNNGNQYRCEITNEYGLTLITEPLFSVTVVPVDKFTVSYDANKGEGAPEAQTKIDGLDLTLSSDAPTRDGYTFLGWATSEDASEAEYQAGGSYIKDESVTLYAVWKKNVTFAAPTGLSNSYSASSANRSLNGQQSPVLSHIMFTAPHPPASLIPRLEAVPRPAIPTAAQQ